MFEERVERISKQTSVNKVFEERVERISMQTSVKKVFDERVECLTQLRKPGFNCVSGALRLYAC